LTSLTKPALSWEIKSLKIDFLKPKNYFCTMGIVRENEFLIDVLKKLDFFSSDISIKNNFPEIIFTKNPPSTLHPKHYIALEFAEILDADAVYFKYYDDNRFCVPQVYFYDNSNGIYDKNKIAEIHRNVYSSNQVALICVIDKASVSLFDTRKPIKIADNSQFTNKNCLIKKPYSFKELDLLSKYFNAKELNSGDFWESNEASTHFKNNESVYEELVNALSLIRKDFHKVFQTFSIFVNEKAANDFADEILFKCILIKYLEENGLEFAQQFYKDNFIQQNSLNEILESGHLIKLLDCLEFHFNGNVFSIDEDKKNILKDLKLADLALCLEGKYGSNRTGYLWEMYSFKHIPIELISNFYEEFIPKDKENSGTVYTPSHLVNLLIDECLPLSDQQEHLNSNVRLADVSCGSGIFITTAFKRLVQRLRIEKWIEAGKPIELPQPTLQEVKNILSNNIFGIDKNDTATKLAKFSLQLAICQLVPKNELWTWNEDRVFKDLQDRNVFSDDFFDFLIKEKSFHNSLDLIIGNPPFQSLKEDKINKEYSTITKKLKSALDFEFSVKIPFNQLALMFLEVSSLLLKPKGDLCFVQKSTSLLYNSGSKEFRNSLFNQFYVHQIIDFTLLKNDLFKSKGKEILDNNGKPKLDKKGKPQKGKPTSVESCAVFYKKEYKEEDYITNHIVSRLLKNTKDGLSFEFDYYDFHEIPKQTTLEDDTIWRCNLLGGNRLNHLIKKLNKKTKSQTNLEDYLHNYLGIEEELFCEGFIRATPQGEKDGKNFECEYITNKLILTATNFDKNKYDNFSKQQRFYRAPREKAFKSPLITIKEQITEAKSFIKIHSNDVAYDSRIVGISLFEIGMEKAEKLYTILQKNEKINSLKTLATCSQFFLGSSSVIQKADINKWTIPLEEDEIKLSDSEKIIMNDVLDYIYPSWYEKEPIINKKETSIAELIEFGAVFNESFNSIYKKENKEQKLATIYEGSNFFALEFEYSEKQIIEPRQIDKTEADKQIERLIVNQYGKNTLVNKVLRIYSPNKITLIKPKKLRFWLKSIALQDSDEIFDDIIENGLR
jgi:methylase of polypeptide subunit release factors